MSNATAAKANNYWLELSDGKFSLYVDGARRAVANTGDNNASLVGGWERRSERLVVPNSKSVFNAVEEKLGIQPVRQFRNEFGPTIINWRAMDEARAAAFRKANPNEAEYHLNQAWEMLNAKSQWGLSTKGSEARSQLGPALTALERNGSKWTPEICERAETAREYLSEAPVRADSMFEPQAKHHCEKALAAMSPSENLGLTDSQMSARQWHGPRKGRGRSM